MIESNSKLILQIDIINMKAEKAAKIQNKIRN